MNKKTVASLLLIANLYGQISSANEMVVSEARLQNLSGQEVASLLNLGAIEMRGKEVILNLQKLNSILKDQSLATNLANEANKMATRFVPYGNSLHSQVNVNDDLIEQLTVRYVPYGNS